MERCPTCQAAYHGGTVCSRCGGELTALLLLEQRADFLLRSAVARLADGDPAGAALSLKQAQWIRRNALASALQAFLARQVEEAACSGLEPHFWVDEVLDL